MIGKDRKSQKLLESYSAFEAFVHRHHSTDELMQKGFGHYGLNSVNLIDAYKWFNLARIMGNEKAEHYLDVLSEEMSEYELDEARLKTREWLRID